MGASSGAISTVSGVAMTPPLAGPGRRGSLTQAWRRVDATLVRTNRTPPSNVSDTGPPRDASLLTRVEWHGGCYRKRGWNPGIGGQEIMAVDSVLLHIII